MSYSEKAYVKQDAHTDCKTVIHLYQSFAVGRLPSKADDMRVSLRAILLSKIASLHERTAGRLAKPADQ